MQLGPDLARLGVELSNPVWRISLKRHAALSAPPANVQVHGRFDDPLDPDIDNDEDYSVLYCAQSPTVAFIEAMGGLRPRLGAVDELISPVMLSIDEREATSSYQQFAGVVTRDWQLASQLTSGNLITLTRLFDLTSAEAVQTLRIHLAPSLIAMGLDDLDFGELLGSNRTLTRAISRWLWTMESDSGQPIFSGIRYRSRFDPECICLALYQDRYSIDGDVHTQPITPDTPGFAEAATILRLKIS